MRYDGERGEISGEWADMAIRGRPPSPIPEKDVERLAERAGMSLGGDEDAAASRKSALGALMGYATGLTFGVVYAVVAPAASRLPWPLAAAVVGGGAMAVTDASSTLLGTAEPRTWSAQGWAADAVPHLAYGAGVVFAYDALSG